MSQGKNRNVFVGSSYDVMVFIYKFYILFQCFVIRTSHDYFNARQKNGKVHLATAFFKEVLSESKDALDDDAITDIIKVCNVIKNEKLQEQKRKVKGQAQKSKKKDKVAEKKAKQMAIELYGDNDQFDDYDDYGAQYEDAFF